MGSGDQADWHPSISSRQATPLSRATPPEDEEDIHLGAPVAGRVQRNFVFFFLHDLDKPVKLIGSPEWRNLFTGQVIVATSLHWGVSRMDEEAWGEMCGIGSIGDVDQ